LKLKKIVGFLLALTQRGRRHLAKLALLSIIMAMCTLMPGLGQRASATTNSTARQSCQVVLVPASTWLGGQGVDACKNIWGNDTSHPSGYGPEWQCVELAQALYSQRGWYAGNIFPNTGFAYQIYDNASSLGFIRHANGDGIPVPGDMIIHDPASSNYYAGHVSIVDYVAGSHVYVVEQNASSTGRATYTLNGSTLFRQGYSSIRGYVHAPGNQITTPPPPTSTMVKTASAVPSPSHHPADFSLHAGTQVAEYNSTTNSFSYQGTWVQPVGAIDWAAAGDFNGDGKADFALHASNAIYVYLSTGSSFAFQGVWVSPVGAFDSGWLADFNGS
jgi:CHAP domain/FG-GAP repeat